MSFSYVSTDPFSTSVSEIRFRLGDVTSSNAHLGDEEIQGVVDNVSGNNTMLASVCAQAVAAKLAREVSVAEAAFRISAQQQWEHYRQLAEDLRAESRRGLGLPYAGGISVADVASVKGNTNRVSPAFAVKQFDSPQST